jgi:hypothetical protein
VSPAEWISALGDRDPSVPIALAAITRAAADSDTVDFADLVMTYREAHIACYRGEFPHAPQAELSGDEVRDHLTRSVLPRLATEGWVLETGDTGWNPVKPRVPWWGQSAEARQEVYESLLEAARRAVQRAKVLTPQAGPASMLEGLDLSKSFKGRRVVNEVTVRVQQGEIVGLLARTGRERRRPSTLLRG